MGARYVWYLEAGSASLVAALDLIADDATHPLVFHCAAGKDRTGIVAALVLGALGVVREAIIADYEETSARMDLIVERFRQSGTYGRALDGSRPGRSRADPAHISEFLDELDARFGGAGEWLLSAGLAADALGRLRQGLLEDDVG
jgi:protein tyrosine/serine phosphatase